MTDREQLAKAKENWEYRSGSLSDNVKWLIEQAERVEELEGNLAFESNRHDKFKKIMKDYSTEMEAENKKLREALKESINIIALQPLDPVMSKLADIVLKALEESK